MTKLAWRIGGLIPVVRRVRELEAERARTLAGIAEAMVLIGEISEQVRNRR